VPSAWYTRDEDRGACEFYGAWKSFFGFHDNLTTGYPVIAVETGFGMIHFGYSRKDFRVNWICNKNSFYIAKRLKTFILPDKISRISHHVTDEVVMSDSVKKNLLLVEDEVILAMTEKMQLEKYGYGVRTVSTGEKAVEAVKTIPEIDLVLMDINLGDGIDGTEAAEIILRDHDIPILFVSSHSEREVVEMTEKITSYGYVVKNSSITVLDASIKMAFKLFEANQAMKIRSKKDHESAQLLVNIMDSFPGIVFWKDKNSTYKGCNLAFVKSAGFMSKVDIIGKSDYEMPWSKHEAEKYREADRNVLDTGIPKMHILETQHTSAGSSIWLDTSKIPLFDTDGSINGLLGVSLDITEIKNTEEALKESEVRMKNILNSSPMGIHIYELDEQNNLVFVGANQSADTILGINNSLLFGKTIQEAFPPLSNTEIPERYRNAALYGEQWRTEQIDYKDDKISGAFEVVAFQTSQNRMAVYFFDITERKKAEEKLRDSEERFNLAIECTDAGVWDWDMVNDKVVYSVRWKNMLGYADHEIENAFSGWKNLWHPDDKEKIEKALDDFLTGKSSKYEIIHRCRHKDGGWRWILTRGDIIKNASGKPVRWVGTNIDITDYENVRISLQTKNEDYEVINEELRSTTEELQEQNEKFRKTGYELRISEDKFLKIFKESPYPVMIVDTDNGCFADVNEEASRSLEFSREELIGKSAVELGIILPEAEFETRKMIIESGQYTDYEVPVKTKSGKTCIALATGRIIEIDNHAYLIQTIIDITERKAAGELFDKHLTEMEFLSHSAVEFINLDTDANIYQFIAEKIAFLLPDYRIIVNEYDEKVQMATVKAIRISDSIIAKVIKLFGRNLIGLKTPIPPEPKHQLLSHKIFAGPEGVYELAGGVIPKFICNKIDNLLDFGKIYVMGFSSNNLLHGDIIFISPKGVLLENTEFIESFIELASMAVQKNLADKRIKSLLDEKELLLKEVHHRIKNNMNTVSSLLSLQAQAVNEPSVVSALQEARGKVQSMSILYDKLYRSSDFTEVSLNGYLTSLVDEVVANFPNSLNVIIEKDLDDFMLDAKRVQSIGIIINELLTNIMKYAFRGRVTGLITILSKNIDGKVNLSVQDNGVGMSESISFENSNGFGLQLVQALTQQLNGRIRIERGNGSKVVLEFDV